MQKELATKDPLCQTIQSKDAWLTQELKLQHNKSEHNRIYNNETSVKFSLISSQM